jgi:hypothetical protein
MAFKSALTGWIDYASTRFAKRLRTKNPDLDRNRRRHWKDI